MIPAHKINEQIGPRMRASILKAVQACFKYAMGPTKNLNLVLAKLDPELGTAQP